MVVTMDDFFYSLTQINPSTQRENQIDFIKISWDDIGGLEEIKKVLFYLNYY